MVEKLRCILLHALQANGWFLRLLPERGNFGDLQKEMRMICRGVVSPAIGSFAYMPVGATH
jgi:hypothetical protein